MSRLVMFVTAAAAGAGVGLLFAPHNGRKMRRIIRHKAAGARLRAEKLGDAVANRAHWVETTIGQPGRYLKQAGRALGV